MNNKIAANNKIKKKALVFDLDGTLADTLASLAASGNAMLESYGIPARPEEEYKYHAGNGSRTLVERALRVSGREGAEPSLDAAYQRYLECFGRLCCYEVKAFPGLQKLILQLKKEGWLLLVLTNKLQPMAERVMAAAYPEKPFDGIYGQRTGCPLKPDPHAADQMMDAFSLKSEDVLYCGDTDIDMQMAENCGFTSIGVSWGSRSVEELEKTSANYIARDVNELEAIICSFR